jgi:hypothetical protein
VSSGFYQAGGRQLGSRLSAVRRLRRIYHNKLRGYLMCELYGIVVEIVNLFFNVFRFTFKAKNII